MALIAREAITHLRHALSGGLPEGLSPLRILNQAGELLCASWRWKFLERPLQTLNTRGSRSGTKFTFTVADHTLTNASASAFGGSDMSAFTLLAGDRIRILAASVSNVVPQDVYVESVTDEDNIILEKDITNNKTNVTASSSGGVDWDSIDGFSAIALPSDFGEMIAHEAGSGLASSFEMTSFDSLLALRSDTASAAGSHYVGAISHGLPVHTVGKGPVSGGSQDDLPTEFAGEPVPRLELWPNVTTDQNFQIRVLYRAKWTPLLSDATPVSIPVYMESLYIELVRAFALGYEEDNVAGVEPRVASVMGDRRSMLGRLLKAAAERDGAVQNRYGPLVGGAVSSGRSVWDWGQGSTISDPS